MTSILYEHPLNEKVRTYLRVDHLFTQVKEYLPMQTQWQQQGFFTSLFALIEVLDRNDVRPDLLKDIERCEASLVNWSQHPQISDDALHEMLKKAVRLQSELLRGPKFANCLKENTFLSPLRQRFFIPGGTCPFDLPQLQFWSELPQSTRQQQASHWLEQLSVVESAIGFVLRFIRERGQFQAMIAPQGFYQSNTEQFELLRLTYDSALGSYPTISGNRYRYAIRFMQLSEALERTTSHQDIHFHLACC